jgi:hypothetical protein
MVAIEEALASSDIQMAENRSMAALCGSRNPDLWLVARGRTPET